MRNDNFICKKFISTEINKGICTASQELSLSIYPNLYEIKTFCKTKNYQKCPLLNVSTINFSSCV